MTVAAVGRAAVGGGGRLLGVAPQVVGVVLLFIYERTRHMLAKTRTAPTAKQPSHAAVDYREGWLEVFRPAEPMDIN